MKAKVDSVGRILIPKSMRDAVGIYTDTVVDIAPYGAGLQLTVGGRTAQLVEEDGVLVAASETEVDDDVVFALTDAGRR